jgi:GGDEF domain-containing protein
LISTTPLNWEGTAISVSVSYGLYSFSGTEDAGEALQRADQAMYEQKHSRAIGD